MASKGESEKLFEQSPYKEKLELARKQVLADAVMEQFDKNLDIPDAELKEYYEKHKDDFAVAAVQSLLVPTKSKEEEAAATAKARQLAGQMKGEAEAASLIAQYPGGLTSIRKGDANMDAGIRAAVFALKPGEVTAPIAQPNGIYVFRLSSVGTPDFQSAEANIRRIVADARFHAWIEDVQKSVTVAPVKAPGGN